MRKILLLLSLALLPHILFAQTKKIAINWEDRSQSASNGSFDTQKSNSVSDSDTDVTPLFKLRANKEEMIFQDQWRDNGFVDRESLKLTNIRYSNLSSAELNQINKNLVPNEITSSIRSSRSREKIYTTISISPVVKSGGSYKKVVSLTVSYKFKSPNGGNNSRMPLSNSVLANGAWYKFKIEQTGIHRVDKNFLNDIGFNTDGIDPRTLKIYGHGGKPLPLLNVLNTNLDLPENAIQVIGEEDGSFDSGDAILFYAISTQGYDLENDTNLNPYADETYYYITAGGAPGKRVQPMLEPTGTPSQIINKFHSYQFHELDEESPAKVGRRWFGNRFDIENEQSFEFNFPNILAGENMRVVIKAAAASEISTSMALSVNGTSLDPLLFTAAAGQNLINTQNFDGGIPAGGSETVTVDLNYNNGGNPSSIGYLDYIRIEALRRLAGVDGQLAFQFNDVQILSGVGQYEISNASQFEQVWDVTNIGVISAKLNENSSSSFTFKATLGELRKYVAVNPNDYFLPIEAAQSSVVNQDLKGTIFNDESGNFKDLDYIIVAPAFLIQPALRLANHHRTVNGLNVKVVTTDKIYEEFSSGKQDISAIRNFVRYVYDNASTVQNKLKYLCLFGDTSIDYKNRLANNNNIVPTFHTYESNSSTTSFMSDDFFGNMDLDEGTIGRRYLLPDGTIGTDDIDRLDIAVGRILADDVITANTQVDKIINYESKVSYGNWRNNFVLISDDVDVEWEYHRLEVVLDKIGDQISDGKPHINVKKLHSDAFQQQTSAGGNRYPEVNEAIQNATEVGALVINYFGHGGEDGLAKEFIYTKDLAQNLRNKNRFPCIVTVTCEFTKFDLPSRITAGELTYANPEGGAISLITTTRSIGVSLGVDFNQELVKELYALGSELAPNAPAEALRITKNAIPSDLRRVIFYIGDPAMHLAFPKRSIRLTTLNGVPIGQATDTLKALSRVTIGGEVLNEQGGLLSNYNGILEAKVFDKNVQRQTLGNDGIRDAVTNQLLILDFITLGEGLFNGQATVANGKFEFEFVVPRDIQIPIGTGKVSLYSQRDNTLEDQTGANLTLKVGGLDENAPEDNQGPLIRLFMNDESFVSGGVTNDSPILIAKLEDEHGINTASGIGHDIVAVLDGDEANPFILNEYYQADVDDFTKGTASYRLRDLEDGLHTLTLKAWDVYNNSSTADIQFIVAGNDVLEITRVLNYPNPFVNYTEFWFNHNRPFEPLEVQVQVFTITGKVVWTQNQLISTEGFLSRDIVWDGKDDFGDRIGKGVYVYKITVKSSLTNQRAEKFEKLVIL